MKNVVLFLGLTLAVSFTYAQKSKVVSAYNYQKFGELDNAKKAIDEASENEESKGMAKTWMYRGQIYHAIHESKDPKYKDLSPNALEEAVKSYKKVLELDEKKVYTEEVNQRLKVAAGQFAFRGGQDFNNKDYASAVKNFENAIDINKNVFKDPDTLSTFNAAVAAERMKDYAKSKQMYQSLIDVKSGGAKVYLYLASVIKSSGDAPGALETIKTGRALYPTDKDLILEELNYYLENGKDKEALANCELAIKADPTNAILYFAQGTVQDKLEMFALAEASYKKAIELKPDYFDACYNLGALYFNQGVKMTDVANNITDNAKYQKEIAKADGVFKQAIPYLEKAAEINPEDKNTLLSLKQLYARLDMKDKYKEIEQKLK
jgi:tetratricopeptide (TPR) repeat protein